MSDYEPPAEMVADMQRELEAAAWNGGNTSAARFVLRRQHEREGLLRDAMCIALEKVTPGFHLTTIERSIRDILSNALAAHAKLDAPKTPTVAECAVHLRDAWANARGNRLDGPLTLALEHWFAAVEREEKR